MAKKKIFEWDDEVGISVKATVYPGSPGTMYLRNGDPGDPPEPPEVDFDSVTVMVCGTAVDISDKLTDAQWDALSEKIYDLACDSDEGECA